MEKPRARLIVGWRQHAAQVRAIKARMRGFHVAKSEAQPAAEPAKKKP